MAAKDSANYSLYDCLPCREGCEECVDDTPCMYPRNMSLRTLFLVVNEIIKAVAIALAVFIFLFRETKVTTSRLRANEAKGKACIRAYWPLRQELIAVSIARSEKK